MIVGMTDEPNAITIEEETTVVVASGTTVTTEGESLVLTESGMTVTVDEETIVTSEGGTTVIVNESVTITTGSGIQGPAGNGVPVGGATDDVLVKVSGTSYDTEWTDALTLDLLGFDTAAAETVAVGQVAWDTDRGTLHLGLLDANVLHVGQATLFYVHNKTGATITKGTVCAFAGSDGNSGKLLVQKFAADGTMPSKYLMGLALDDITHDSFGYVLHFGEVRGVNTAVWAAGTTLYADPAVVGGLTSTAPIAPNSRTTVAAVVTSSNNGTLFVRPTFGSNLAEDELVNLSGLADGDTIMYNAATGVFENTNTVVQSTTISTIVALTQAAYDALTPDSSTMYVIVG